MHPELFKIGPIPIHTYGLLVGVGFLLGLNIVKRLAERAKLNVDRLLDLAFWSLLVGFVGARVLFMITRWSDFLADPLSFFRIWEGGLVFWGGPIVVVPLVAWYVRKFRLPLWRTLDVLAPGLVIAHALGRFGCLAAGCCYGKPTGSSFGIKLYSDLVDIGLRGVPLHPTQLYEAGSLFILLGGLLYLFPRRVFDGQVVLAYFMSYSVIRSIIEVFRGDLIRGFVIDEWLSTSQFISALVFFGAAFFLMFRLKQEREKLTRTSK